MFATFAGTYSRKPLPGLPDLLGEAERDLDEGKIDASAYEAAVDAFVTEILGEMAVLQLSIAGDGGARARDRVLPWIRGLGGLGPGDVTALPGGEPATRPRVTGPVVWTQPLTVRDWQFANDASEAYVKQTFVGPYTLAALAEPSSRGRRRAALSLGFAEAMNAELRALLEAGCPIVEVDEPAVLRVGGDVREWSTFRLAGERLAAGVDDPSEIHLSLGLWGGEIDRCGHAALLGLPYSSYLVDVLAGPSAWRFVAAVPPERGVIVGTGDAATESLDETEVIVWAMAWAAAGGRGSERVGAAPNGSLHRLGRHFAMRKCQRIAESVNIARMGPLEEVAVALDEQPLVSRMAELRTMAEAVEEARSA